MINKGFDIKTSVDVTPDMEVDLKKPLKSKENITKRVDINILKTRIQERESKEYKQNVIIFLFFLISLGTLGIYLSI